MSSTTSSNTSPSTAASPAINSSSQSQSESNALETPIASRPTKTATELAYKDGNNSMKYLVVLSFGLKKEDGSEFIDNKDEQPWASVPRGEIKPTYGYVEG
jgi:DMSO/TMAO reductase YedYZ molybdopterin-dependent catalytic subunit